MQLRVEQPFNRNTAKIHSRKHVQVPQCLNCKVFKLDVMWSARPQLRARSAATNHASAPESTWQLNGTETVQELLHKCQSPQATTPISQEAATGLLATLDATALATLNHKDLCTLLQSLATLLPDSLPEEWNKTLQVHIESRIRNELSEDDMPDLAKLLWAIMEVSPEHTSPGLLSAAMQRVVSGIEAGSFFAKDLCTCACALGSLGYQPSAQETATLAKEVQFQLKEFLSDFTAEDVARLANGVADLGCSAAFSDDFSDQLMKAVYSKVWTIEDKAMVDFALSRMSTQDKSMHYDPRWTHEELRWLPRRERDKRRLIKENWVRTHWGGW